MADHFVMTCKQCTIVDALMERSRRFDEDARRAHAAGREATSETFHNESIRLNDIAQEVAVIHASQIANDTIEDQTYQLPDGSTLGDWIAAAKAVHSTESSL